jgi:DNA-binding PadR family transcriptional regulator
LRPTHLQLLFNITAAGARDYALEGFVGRLGPSRIDAMIVMYIFNDVKITPAVLMDKMRRVHPNWSKSSSYVCIRDLKKRGFIRKDKHKGFQLTFMGNSVISRILEYSRSYLDLLEYREPKLLRRPRRRNMYKTRWGKRLRDPELEKL